MSEPRRLLDEDGALGADLLRAARDDAPSAGSRDKTLIALGVAGGVGATMTATTAAAASASAGLIEWIGLGVLGGLLTVGGVAVVKSTDAPQATSAPAQRFAPAVRQRVEVVRAQAARSPDTASPATEPRAAPPPAAEEPQQAPRAEAPRPAPSNAGPPASSAAADKPQPPSLADEVAALDRAREALASGNAGGALKALDDHDRRFPGGLLGPEATVLRIEALAQRGDRAAATRLGQAFLAAHPRSPHASRLRSLLGIAPPAP